MRWATTSWTQVLAARDAPSSESRQALEALCQAYWYPVYALVRHQGFDADEAGDLTQSYFAWIASTGQDNTLRLWPMPDLDKPPLHALPHDELLAKLKSLTNLRAVRVPNSDTDWKIELGPFPGWKDVPTW